MEMSIARPWPIAVMSFNRPNYLSQVLQSVVEQEVDNISEHPIYLFQDGGYNKASNTERAAQSDIDACIELFKKMIPWGKVIRSDRNLGVALNFDRAEKEIFESLDSEVGIFLEDDLVMQPHYLSTLESMIDLARADDRVAYVSVYGNHRLSLSAQASAPGRFFLLEHNWAFALTRRQWLKNKPYVDAYLNIIRGHDYRERPRSEIYRLYHSWGVGCPGDSQDVTKTIACCLNKNVKLNIRACLGKYIGEQGLHMNSKLYRERKYEETQLYPGLIEKLEVLTPQDFDRIFAVQMKWATERPCNI